MDLFKFENICVKCPKISHILIHIVWPKFQFLFSYFLTLVLLNQDVDPDQLASKKPTDLDLHCLSLSIQICINTLN